MGYVRRAEHIDVDDQTAAWLEKCTTLFEVVPHTGRSI